MLILLTILTFFSTLAGGLLALRFRDHLHLILGFSAGTVIAVCFFELIPEALSLGISFYKSDAILTFIFCGFLAYMILDRSMVLHFPFKSRSAGKSGMLAAGSFSLHSFFDGLAIGLAFKVSEPTGIFVAFAVIVHDLSDGMNTVSVLLKDGKNAAYSFKWLFFNSIMPILGVLSAFIFRIHESLFVILISLTTGFFLYIGASDLLPESQHEYPSLWTTCMTLLGAAIIYTASHFLKT